MPRSTEKNAREEKVIVYPVDYAVLITTVILVLFGVVMIFSASYYNAGNSAECNYDIYFYLKRQFAWTIIGFVAMYLMSNINYMKLKKFVTPFFIISNILLFLVLIIGKEVNGAKRWIELGPVSFQPSEISKLALILFLSNFISERKRILTTWRGFFCCLIITLIPTGLIAKENMSTAIVEFLIGMTVVFVASPRFRYFVVSVIIGGIGGTLMVLLGGAFRMGRIKAWLDPFADASDTGFQTVQSLYAIGSGGLFGLGLGQSRQKLYIPEGHNDIIFAIICEELGLFGAIILVFLFAILIWRGLNISMNARNVFGCLIASGIVVMIGIQVVINIAVVTNTIPNTGVPLPFISYGGTSLVFMMASIGLLLNISRYKS